MSTTTIFDRIDTLLAADGTNPAATLAELGAAAVSIAVLDNNTVTSRCYSHNLSYNDQTVFQAASISKAINCLGVMRLVEQGRLSLATTIQASLPADLLALLTDASPASQRPLIENITVRQLLSHTAGLSVSGITGNPDASDLPTMHDSIAGSLRATNLRVRQVELPGTKFRYAGGGTTVLQAIMEHVTGQPYAPLMSELVLEPLGMTRSWYGMLPPNEDNAAAVYITGYKAFPITHFNFPTEAAAALWTTPTDLLKAVAAVQTSLESEGGFLRQETARTMLEEVDSDVALAWFLKKDGDGKVSAFSHSGLNQPGFFSFVFGFTQLKGCGMAFMTNSMEGWPAAHRLALAVAHLKGWPMDWANKGMPVPLGLRDEGAGERWKAWQGVWKDEDKKHKYEIKDSGDGVPGVLFDGVGPLRLVPGAGLRSKKDDGYDEFVMEGMEVLVTLVDKDGEKSVRLTQDAGTVDLTRQS